MTKEERELSIAYLEGMKEEYIEGEGFERYPLPEYYAIEKAIEALKQPEIIRCKDCKQFRKRADIDFTFCDLTESPVFETDFCSRAESENINE